MKAKRTLERIASPVVTKEIAEELRLFPRYTVRHFRKPPVISTKREQIVEVSSGFNLTCGRDEAPGTAEFFVKRGLARRARVLLVTTVTSTKVLCDVMAVGLGNRPKCLHGRCGRTAAPGGRYCKGHAAQHATAGKNGRPELQAVTP